jgi:hypothetical protein
MKENGKSMKIGLWERMLRSRTMRGIFHIQVGFSLVRSWALDVQIHRGTAIHFFDYLLYRRTNQEEPFEEWVRRRELLSP